MRKFLIALVLVFALVVSTAENVVAINHEHTDDCYEYQGGHAHTGTADNGKGCYSVPVYHVHSGDEKNGTECYIVPVYHQHEGNETEGGACYQAILHTHTGNATSGGGCYGVAIYHTHSGDSKSGGECYAQANKHTHSGSAVTGGGCYTVPVYHQHEGNETEGGACYTSAITHMHTGDSTTGGGCYSTLSTATQTCTPKKGAATGPETGWNCGVCGSWVRYIEYYVDGTCGQNHGKMVSMHGTCGCPQTEREDSVPGPHTYQITSYTLGCNMTEESVIGYSLTCTEDESLITGYELGCGKGDAVEGYSLTCSKSTSVPERYDLNCGISEGAVVGYSFVCDKGSDFVVSYNIGCGKDESTIEYYELGCGLEETPGEKVLVCLLTESLEDSSVEENTIVSSESQETDVDENDTQNIIVPVKQNSKSGVPIVATLLIASALLSLVGGFIYLFVVKRCKIMDSNVEEILATSLIVSTKDYVLVDLGNKLQHEPGLQVNLIFNNLFVKKNQDKELRIVIGMYEYRKRVSDEVVVVMREEDYDE